MSRWRLRTESAHFKNGKFQNLSHTPMMAEGVSWRKMLGDFFHPPADAVPPAPLPSIKTDLKALRSDRPVIVWFGHSSYLIHCRGLNILVDPVFSGHASPVSGFVKAYPGAGAYTVADLPDIDLLIITHNHYDHLDRPTLQKLLPKVARCCTTLGTGRSILSCSSQEVPVQELDWWEGAEPLPGVSLTATPARHFSGRGLKRAGALWASFVLRLFGFNLFLGGDSGYDTHFREIGEKFGPFDIAILECGQYNVNWPNIHMMPEETVQAAEDLRARLLLPVHWAKFSLSNHPWDEPVQRALAAAARQDMAMTTPMIGEPVTVGGPYPAGKWWEEVIAAPGTLR